MLQDLKGLATLMIVFFQLLSFCLKAFNYAKQEATAVNHCLTLLITAWNMNDWSAACYIDHAIPFSVTPS